MQPLGLIVLLVSKAGGYTQTSDLEQEKIFHSQRILAETTEMISLSHLLHQGLINIESKTGHDITMGNKVFLLSGDYLLSESYAKLAGLRLVHEIHWKS